MKEDILKTILYLLIVFWGAPTLYFLTSTSLSKEEFKRKAIRIYPITLFILLGITMIIYGVEETTNSIGYAFGRLVFYVFSFVVLCVVFFLVIMILLGNWGMLFNDIRNYIKRKRK